MLQDHLPIVTSNTTMQPMQHACSCAFDAGAAACAQSSAAWLMISPHAGPGPTPCIPSIDCMQWLDTKWRITSWMSFFYPKLYQGSKQMNADRRMPTVHASKGWQTHATHHATGPCTIMSCLFQASASDPKHVWLINHTLLAAHVRVLHKCDTIALLKQYTVAMLASPTVSLQTPITTNEGISSSQHIQSTMGQGCAVPATQHCQRQEQHCSNYAASSISLPPRCVQCPKHLLAGTYVA